MVAFLIVSRDGFQTRTMRMATALMSAVSAAHATRKGATGASELCSAERNPVAAPRSSGLAATRIARHGLMAQAIASVEYPNQESPKIPNPTASQNPIQIVRMRIVAESAWNVLSRQSATADPSEPLASVANRVTQKTRPTCPSETPPRSAVASRIGTDTTIKTRIDRSAAHSLPSTSSLFVSRVSSRSRSVLRSFSCPTAAAASVAPKKSVTTS